MFFSLKVMSMYLSTLDTRMMWDKGKVFVSFCRRIVEIEMSQNRSSRNAIRGETNDTLEKNRQSREMLSHANNSEKKTRTHRTNTK